MEVGPPETEGPGLQTMCFPWGQHPQVSSGSWGKGGEDLTYYNGPSWPSEVQQYLTEVLFHVFSFSSREGSFLCLGDTDGNGLGIAALGQASLSTSLEAPPLHVSNPAHVFWSPFMIQPILECLLSVHTANTLVMQ